MSAKIRLPGILCQFAEGQRIVSVDSESVGAALTDLSARYPSIGERILDEQGRPQRFVNVYVNGEDSRLLNGIDTPLADGDEVILAPAVAGG